MDVKKSTMLNDQDISQIKKQGVALQEIEDQLNRFRQGFPFIKIVKAATLDDGIKKLGKDELEAKAQRYEVDSAQRLKFIPASGAASRMFKSLFSFMEDYRQEKISYEDLTTREEYKPVLDFFRQIEKFAFYQDLKSIMSRDGEHLEERMLKRDFDKVLDYLLNDTGLNYGHMPKALLKFHKYGDRVRTPVEEHLVEGANYCQSAGGKVFIHFTVPPDYMGQFQEHVKEVLPVYEKEFDVTYDISFSVQKPSTDTLAVDLNNKPFREEDDRLLFRPGGHGALLNNLNEFDFDLIFIKNIDNVAPDRLKADTYLYKKVLGGILLDYQKTIFGYLHELTNGETPSDERLDEMLAFTLDELCVQPGSNLSSGDEKVAFLKKKLNRPIRVCGMVKNEGEPGGGPYWTLNPDGSVSLQIVESSQVDMNDTEQEQIFKNATHFNPVDIVLSVKNHRGEKFNIMNYRDPETGFISQKSKNGRSLKALELPGLWNGSMSDWNTVFVEVPVATFSPVKTINDLLRDEHQSE